MRESRARGGAALATALALALAAGCGGGSDGGAAATGSDEDRIRAVYREYSAAMGAGDARGVCSRMTPKLQRRKGFGGTCIAWYQNMLKVAPPGPERAFFASLKVEGDEAHGLVTSKGGQPYPIRFAKHDGEWKMSGRGTSGGGLDARREVSSGATTPRRGPRYEIRSSYAAFVDYLHALSAPAVCSKLTRSFQRRLGGEDCKTRLRSIFIGRGFRNATQDIMQLEADGRHATATVRARSGRTYPVRFAREDGSWKVDGGSLLR